MKRAIVLAAVLSCALPAHATWRYQESTDAMRGTKSYSAHLYSTTVLQFQFPHQGGSRLMITAARYPDKPNAAAIAVTKGQFYCLTDGCVVHAKFDDKPVQKFNAVRPAAGASDMIVIQDAARFIAQLTTAKRIIIEAPFYQYGDQQATFDTAPLTWPPSKWPQKASP